MARRMMLCDCLNTLNTFSVKHKPWSYNMELSIVIILVWLFILWVDVD